MTITFRPYRRPDDFETIGHFITGLYQPGNADGNWFQPAWEYMHSHPYLDESALEHIGVWEENEAIVGVATYESRLGEAFFQLKVGYAQLKPAMLDHAEAHLSAANAEGTRSLHIFINDFDLPFTALAQARGYHRLPDEDRGMLRYAIPEPFPPIHLPEGFRLQSLQEDNDLSKVDRVLWRGFNHPGQPPAGGEADRRKMQSVPRFRKDLNIVAVAPGGQFAAYAGLWFDPTNRLAYVEPVATDPDYRRLGLARAAVQEGIRRCAAEGADSAYVGNDLPVYRSIGFTPIYTTCCWEKTW